MSERRGSTFTVDAESVQGNEGAEVTFRALKVGTLKRIQNGGMQDSELLRDQIVAWSGIVDDEGHDLPDPADDPAVLDDLYIHEQRELVRLLMLGPHGESAKN